MITGNVFYDFVPEGRVEPYVIGGLGLFHHSEQFLDETFRSTEGAFTARRRRADLVEPLDLSSPPSCGWAGNPT